MASRDFRSFGVKFGAIADRWIHGVCPLMVWATFRYGLSKLRVTLLP